MNNPIQTLHELWYERIESYGPELRLTSVDAWFKANPDKLDQWIEWEVQQRLEELGALLDDDE